MATLTLQERLDAAEQAYDNLLTGKAVASFKDENGDEVTYTQASAPRLAAYIEDLKRQLGMATRCAGPMRIVF